MKRTGKIGFLILYSFVISLIHNKPITDPVASDIYNHISSVNLQINGPESIIRREIFEFYSNRNFKPAWSVSGKVSTQLDSLIDMFRRAGEYGLEPSWYFLEELLNNSGKRELALLDIKATVAVMMFAMHLISGRIGPTDLGSQWRIKLKTISVGVYVADALREQKISRLPDQLEPSTDQYRFLKLSLRKYTGIYKKGNWPIIGCSGVSDTVDSAIVSLVKDRLLREDFYTENKLPEDSSFGHSYTLAVMNFQEQHGISVDGIIGPETIKALNETVEKKIQRIKINMDRLRWYSELSPGKHIKINLPEFKLDLIDQEQSFLSLNVIIGKRYNSTPVIMDSIKYIVVNPDWTVPQSIAVNELLPQIKKGGFIFDDFIIYESWKSDAAQINPDSIDWAAVVPNSFHYKIIQRPGLANPLGRIKFLFPNNSNIYLHDTPFDYLFDIPQRTFSHGCIRVADPFILACRLLEDDSAGTAALIDSYAFEIDSSIYIPLKDPVPIVIEYKTVFMDELRRLNFRADIYRHDSLHEENVMKKGEEYKVNRFENRFF